MENNERTVLSCSDCGTCACQKGKGAMPDFCLTKGSPNGQPVREIIAGVKEKLTHDEADAAVMRAAAEVEGDYFCRMTRVEEVCEFAKKMGYKKIGVATCHGLMDLARVFAKVLEAKGFDYVIAGCKIGAVDKTKVGIPEEVKINPGTYEPVCNPILQAKVLNAHKTDFNVIFGLCVGHDSLFMKYSDALCTTLIAKDRVLGHAPALALYTANEYYTRLFEKESVEVRKR